MEKNIEFESLFQAAMATWGQERAEAMRQNLERIAASLKEIAENPPVRDQEPAFFL